MKQAMITGAALTAFPIVLVRKSPAAWARKTIVHPTVDNLRVVGLTDIRMTKIHETGSPWARQNELVITEAVWEDIDRLACVLAQTRNSTEAWRQIFIKPPRKGWSETVVAIKTNNIAQQHTRSAVMAKIVHTLTNTLGVKPSNIHIYDACHGSEMSTYTPFADLPEGCRIEETWGGSTEFTAVPAPWKGSGGRAHCLRHLVDGSVDILINIALCKGHSTQFGGFTMAMKNHFGTFSPRPGHQSGGQDYLIAINQTPEILGSMDSRTGKVLYPRQQLCLIDALWAGKGGPGGNPSHQPNFLAMGVLAPIVDYQIATKFRGEKMGWEPNMEMARRMLTEFGYIEADLPQGGTLIEL
ncbi:MAG: hypothetical protein A2Y65_11845 [Deltaproteobacteria bacterium RBG_13_52_11]|nr:MAG: hypothetical protein A2Y65_11845 [Deltaproteobacteria bacterium RBG_13_52_11]